MSAVGRMRLIGCLLLALANATWAGTACRETVATPENLARASATAITVARELDRRDVPLALVAREGKDLSKYGLHYSHIAFVVRDHADGRWTVVHLLNRCGTDRSGLYADGLVDFFADDLVTQDAKLIWLAADMNQRVLHALNDGQAHVLHQPHYNVIARPDSMRYQNSTAWIEEVLVAAATPRSEPDRETAHHAAHALGFTPDVLAIPYSQRVLGGLFSANASFTDHPLAARLGGRYEVVTVRSILRGARANDWIAQEWVLGDETRGD